MIPSSCGDFVGAVAAARIAEIGDETGSAAAAAIEENR